MVHMVTLTVYQKRYRCHQIADFGLCYKAGNGTLYKIVKSGTYTYSYDKESPLSENMIAEDEEDEANATAGQDDESAIAKDEGNAIAKDDANATTEEDDKSAIAEVDESATAQDDQTTNAKEDDVVITSVTKARVPKGWLGTRQEYLAYRKAVVAYEAGKTYNASKFPEMAKKAWEDVNKKLDSMKDDIINNQNHGFKGLALHQRSLAESLAAQSAKQHAELLNAIAKKDDKSAIANEDDKSAIAQGDKSAIAMDDQSAIADEDDKSEIADNDTPAVAASSSASLEELREQVAAARKAATAKAAAEKRAATEKAAAEKRAATAKAAAEKRKQRDEANLAKKKAKLEAELAKLK